MPDNANWVCFACRTHHRQPALSKRVPACPGCGADCFDLGDRVAIPRKRDLSGWRDLHRECLRREASAISWNLRKKAREAHATELRLKQLKLRPATPGRQKFILDLQQQGEIQNPLKAIKRRNYPRTKTGPKAG